MNAPLISRAKSVGILAAAAVGDALGWPQENRSRIVGGNAARNVPPEPRFRAWERNGGTQFARYIDPVRLGEYSDDTQLLLAVARACLRGDGWYNWLTRVELPIWPTFERGGGGAVLAAARAWADKRPPWISGNQRDEANVGRYFNAGANGVAMRIAPHAIRTAESDPSELMARVVRDGLTTHGHPRALVGGCLHALTIRHAIRLQGTLGYGELLNAVATDDIWRHPDFFTDAIDDDWQRNYVRYVPESGRRPADHWVAVAKEVDDLLRIASNELARGATGNDKRALGALGCFDKTRNGSGTVTAVAAIYVASRTASRPMSGLLRTAYLRDADTDTLCSMTGSLLGAIHGADWLGELLQTVQDSDYITNLAATLTDSTRVGTVHRGAHDHTPVATTRRDLRLWSDQLFHEGHSESAPDGRPWQIREVFTLPTRSTSIVTRAVGVTNDGQTFIHDRTSKNPDPDDGPPGRAPDTPQVRPKSVSAQQQAVIFEPQVASVELHVADVAASARFFAEALGFPVEIGTARAKVGNILVLTQRTGDASPPSQNLGTVTITHPDGLGAVAARTDAFPGVRVEWVKDGAALWVTEPGGNTLRIVTDRPMEPHAQQADTHDIRP